MGHPMDDVDRLESENYGLRDLVASLRAESAALRERVVVLEKVREAAIVADDFVWGDAAGPYLDPKTTVSWVRQFHKVRDGLREAIAAAKPKEADDRTRPVK